MFLVANVDGELKTVLGRGDQFKSLHFAETVSHPLLTRGNTGPFWVVQGRWL